MLAGIFEFEDVDAQLLSVIFCSTTVILSLVLLGITFTCNQPANMLLVSQIFFELLSFPMIKKLMSVFSCTSTSTWHEINGTMEPFCSINATMALQKERKYELMKAATCPSEMAIETQSECETAAAYLGLGDTSATNATIFGELSVTPEATDAHKQGSLLGDDGDEYSFSSLGPVAGSDLASSIPQRCYVERESFDSDEQWHAWYKWYEDDHDLQDSLYWNDANEVQQDGNAVRFSICTQLYNEEKQCMDNDPSTQCWESKHLYYVLVAMLLLIPYYLITLHMQLESQKRQSVVIIDGVWTVVSLQIKFMLAVIASAFGDCYPYVCVRVSIE